MTHGELIKLAERWVRRAHRRYPIVLCEVRMNVLVEQPDVFAVGVSGSLLVECKASRGDFLADAKKPFRADPARGVGQHRYYCAPDGLIAPNDLPDGWGLVGVNDRGQARETVSASRIPLPVDSAAERVLLIAALQRAVQGWGRRMFGDDAPAVMVDGDAHPSATKIIREQRRELDRMKAEIKEWQARCASLERARNEEKTNG